MAYHIYLDLFEGPLDLLLYLISKAQIDIKDNLCIEGYRSVY